MSTEREQDPLDYYSRNNPRYLSKERNKTALGRFARFINEVFDAIYRPAVLVLLYFILKHL